MALRTPFLYSFTDFVALMIWEVLNSPVSTATRDGYILWPFLFLYHYPYSFLAEQPTKRTIFCHVRCTILPRRRFHLNYMLKSFVNICVVGARPQIIFISAPLFFSLKRFKLPFFIPVEFWRVKRKQQWDHVKLILHTQINRV